MQNLKYKIIISFCIITGLILPSFGLAQEQTAAPQTVEEAKDIGIKMLEKLPDAVKSVWWEEGLPILKKTWEISIKLWNKTLGPVIEPWLRKEVGKRRPVLEQEFKKEKKEMQNDLWERFKDLFE